METLRPISLLISPPQGMTIDSTTGKISWTPAATGAFNVTVVAQNNAGQDTQDFVVTVNEDPLCLNGIIAYWKLDEGQGNTYDDFIDAHEGSCIGHARRLPPDRLEVRRLSTGLTPESMSPLMLRSIGQPMEASPSNTG